MTGPLRPRAIARRGTGLVGLNESSTAEPRSGPVSAPADQAPPARPTVATPAAHAAPAAPAAPAATQSDQSPRPRRTFPSWVLKPLLGLVLAVVALVVMIGLSRSTGDTSAPVGASFPVSSSLTPVPVPAGTQAGTITVGGVFLLPLSTATDSSGSLAARTGLVVQAQGVRVLSTPSANSAWVGTSAANRVYVQLVDASAGAVTPAIDQRISFTGTMVPNRGGLAAGDGADLLAQQGQHVEVFVGTVHTP